MGVSSASGGGSPAVAASRPAAFEALGTTRRQGQDAKVRGLNDADPLLQLHARTTLNGAKKRRRVLTHVFLAHQKES